MRRKKVSELQTWVSLMKKARCLRGSLEAGMENGGDLLQEQELAICVQGILKLLWIHDCSVPPSPPPTLKCKHLF